LKEGTSLEDRLAHSLSDERLEGDNQYFCQACGIKRDATRSAEITSLPPVLHFSLLRFVFDPKTFERRKSRASITFPIVTQLGGHSYRLQAIITHSGPSAHEGHFVCEAKDMSSGKWYMCDDEDVSVIARSGALNGNGDGNSNGHVPQFGFGAGSRGGPPRKRPRTDENTLKSKDAYMLVYNRLADQQTSPPPVDIKQKVDLEVAEWFNGQGRQELEKIRLEDEYAGLVGAKRQVARLLPGMDCLVPTAQLERWFGAKKLDELFKPWDIPVCPHGDVDPDSTGRYKMISLDAFEVLQHYGFGIPSGWRPANEARPMAKRPQREVIDLSIDSPAADPTSISERAPVEVVNGNGKRTYLPSFDGVTDSTTPVDKPASDLQSHDLSDRAKAPPESFDLSEKRTAIASSSKSTNTGVDMSRSSTTQSGTQTFDILPRMTICPICVEAEYKSRTAPGMSKEDKELWKAEIKIDRQIIKFLDQKFITYGVDYYYLPDSFVERWMDFIKSEHAPRPILEADLGRCEHGLLDVDLEMDPIHRIPRNGWDQIVEK
jgi:ubiquitin carboxyl-terminal hydrolase 48